ncbi:cell division protein FtsI [Enterobacter cancerogenus]|uniref:Peptidoglycan D,D-transpeptidase FtsI n=1 Tax=Enterobacter cancerogenus TaxID=69218 RepID=A0AB38NY46_9ENTR|nr:penicillin-binding transpeptidase domain-containing protein [Enterobacter cancerogenus]TKK12378.1 cell division protein FtsI [Enterobacter cancerogenus]
MKNKLSIRLTSPEKGFSNVRFNILLAGIALIFIVLVVRLTGLQLVDHVVLENAADRRSVRTLALPAQRGTLTDRYGVVLAMSVPARDIIADPKRIAAANPDFADARWAFLADLLNITQGELRKTIEDNSDKEFLFLRKKAPLTLSRAVSQLYLPGISQEYNENRYYPLGEASASLIGVTGAENKGLSGIEQSFNSVLSKEAGVKKIRKDARGGTISVLQYDAPETSPAIGLSIDSVLQYIVYSRLREGVEQHHAESGAAVLVSVNTGEILAMASYPSFNPNRFSRATSTEMRNVAINDSFEPGSTVKPFVILEGLRRHIISSSTLLDTRPFRVDGHLIRDVGYWPALTPTGILQKSSDTGVSHIALAMPSDALVKTYSSFGLGKPTELGLPGESTGYFPFSRHRWADIERATFAFGYGLRVTPLQLARAYATLGACGVYHPLSVTRLTAPVYGEQVADPQLAGAVIRMMESDVLPGGSGVRAAVPGYRLAIKTGTAEKLGTGGKYDGGHITYTAGVAPASRPEVALVVVINNPKAGKHFGGSVAAPVFGQIIGQVLTRLKVTPDAIRGPVMQRQSG